MRGFQPGVPALFAAAYVIVGRLVHVHNLFFESPNADFQGRGETLARMDEILLPSPTSTETTEDVKSLIVTDHYNALSDMGSLFSKTKKTKSSSHFNELDMIGHAFVCLPLTPLDLGIKILLLFLR